VHTTVSFRGTKKKFDVYVLGRVQPGISYMVLDDDNLSYNQYLKITQLVTRVLSQGVHTLLSARNVAKA
jgi:allophanate hydrolase subunit 1